MTLTFRPQEALETHKPLGQYLSSYHLLNKKVIANSEDLKNFKSLSPWPSGNVCGVDSTEKQKKDQYL